MSEISKTQRLPMRPRSRERLLIVGGGPVARALGAALEAADAAPLRWSRRTDTALPSADVVVLAVRDEAIGEVAAQIMSGVDEAATPPILLHCAGALPAEEAFSGLKRRPLGVGVLHPLRALAGAAGDAQLAGTVFAVEGDGPGREAALRLVDRVGGTPLVLEAEQLPRYHAAAALVSNHAVALVDAGVELLSSVGLQRAAATRALGALLGSTAANLERVGLPEALTGPIARGDVAVVARHLLALRPHVEIAALYRATARRVSKVAAEKGRATRDALVRIAALLLE
ncbi:MAG TPA: DUF2520 domain-containing protein [Polyangia bacterium]|jgi:predicted short-subunit dehydrogenase-like oxidoreductase (DUF2520 family)